MSSINKTILIGHLGRDPDIRESKDGKKIAAFSLATSEKWTDAATGEKKEHTDWHNVVVFNDKLGDIVERFLKKGSKCYVEGKSKTRKYTDKAGVERYLTEVVLQGFGGTIVLLDSNSSRPPPADEQSYGSNTATTAPALPDMPDDNVPF